MLRRTFALLGVLVGCHDGKPGDGDTDTDGGIDTDVAESDVVDTEPDTEAVPDDTEVVVDTEPPDLPVDTSTPLAEAEDGPFVGTWAPRGGTRLVAVHLVHEGATQPAFSHFHDTLLDVDCRFALAEDDRLRCLPFEAWQAKATADDRVTKGAVVGETCTGTRHLVEGAGLSRTCHLDGARVTELEPDTDVHELAVERDTGWDAYPLRPNEVFAAVGDRVPVARFVRGVARHVPTGGPLDVVVARGADGSVQPLGFYDPVRDLPCRPVHLREEPAGVLRCAPAADVVAVPYYVLPDEIGYADAECTEFSALEAPQCDSAAVDQGLDPERPPFRWVLDLDVEEVWYLRVLGDAVSQAYGTVGYQPGTGDEICGLMSYSHAMREVLDVVPPDALPLLRRGPVGEGDVRVHAWTDGDGRALRPVDDLPFVAADGFPCTPSWDEEAATTRCVPDAPGAIPWTAVYRNPDCSGPVIGLREGVHEGTVSMPDWYVSPTDCLGPLHVWRGARPWVVGERVPAGSFLYALESDGRGGAICYTTRYVGDDDDFHEVTVDPRPTSAWPVVGLDR